MTNIPFPGNNVSNIPFPSDEQMAIINSVFLNNDVIVNAVSGSGKSTCVLSMAKFINKKILQITYNKSLRHEVKNKAILAGLNNISIHTYHSLAVKYYNNKAFTDDILHKIVSDNLPAERMEYFDIIVIDEAQDMTNLLYNFVYKFIKDMSIWQSRKIEEFTEFGFATRPIKPQIVIMGDEFQAVYEFKGADRRYLTLSNYLWDMNKFFKLPLKTSYRVTRQIADFVNNEMLGYERIVACKDGPPIDYITGSCYENLNNIYFIIKNGNYKPEDIFVLVASIKSKSNYVAYKKLENIFVDNGWPVFVPISDDANLSDSIIQNKIVFSTFHQSKGRERPVVVILGFDNNYFKYYCDNNPNECPPTLYVAATRASHKLIISDNSFDAGQHLPFLKNYNFFHKPYIKHHGRTYTRFFNKFADKHHNYTVHDLTKFIRNDISVKMMPLIDEVFSLIRPAKETIGLLGEYNKEEVSDINAIVIPSIFEYFNSGQLSIKKYIDQHVACQENKSIISLYDIPKNPYTPAEFIKIAIIYHAISTGLNFKLFQIKDYDWLSFNEINWCLSHLDMINGKNSIYEVCIFSIYKSSKFNDIHIYGRLDIMDNSSGYVYEIKCVNTLILEHKLQLLIYCVMGFLNKNIKKYRLLNIKNGECFELLLNWKIIFEIFDLLIINRLGNGNLSYDDIHFLNKTMNT